MTNASSPNHLTQVFPDESLPTVAFNISEGREFLWAKARAGFKYVYENYRDDADWFLRVWLKLE